MAAAFAFALGLEVGMSDDVSASKECIVGELEAGIKSGAEECESYVH